MAPTGPWPGQDDDTGHDCFDTPSGNIWRPDADTVVGQRLRLQHGRVVLRLVALIGKAGQVTLGFRHARRGNRSTGLP